MHDLEEAGLSDRTCVLTSCCSTRRSTSGPLESERAHRHLQLVRHNLPHFVPIKELERFDSLLLFFRRQPCASGPPTSFSRQFWSAAYHRCGFESAVSTVHDGLRSGYYTRGACSAPTVNRRKPANEGSSAVAAASSGGEANELNDEVAVEHNEPKKKVTAGEKVARRAEATTATSGGGGGGRYPTQS